MEKVGGFKLLAYANHKPIQSRIYVYIIYMDRAEGSIGQQLNLPTSILYWTSRSSALQL
ncbi:hypothetical protein F511_02889 [Dorcoceras hygrometricum]|uniref:Uncharacterized protein n=1 Tax=Dorcoceras hygrometricum TaxID=472368 RepID=A0A2Z7AIX5_9LAMI|nr:hypothetical protein F511_02889 [Dorcoceras hygrometricum]